MSANVNPAQPPVTIPQGGFATLRALWPYLWRFRWRILVAMVFLIGAKLAMISVTLLLKQIVDALDPKLAPLTVPVLLLSAYGALRLASTFFTELRQIVFARVMARTARSITLAVFEHLHALSLRFHLERKTGGVSRDLERGMGAVSDLLDWTVYTIIPTLLEITIVSVILIRSFDASFAWITLGTLITYVAFTFSVTEWRIRYYKAMNEADTDANARAVDSLLNYETVKYFNNERFEAQSYDNGLQTLENARVRSLKTLAVLNIGQSSIVAVGLSLLVWRAAAGVVSGAMSIGDLVLVNAFLLQLSIPLNYLGMVYREVKQAMTNIERMFALLAESRDVQDAPDAKPLVADHGAVKFDQVAFGYDPRRQILHDLSFEIPAGHTVAVVGTTGAGKSTLARLLYRFYDVDGGSISINGQDLRSVTQASLRASIGIVPQDTVLFNDTLYFNIAYGRVDATREQVIEAARGAQILELIERLPDGFETQVGERGLKLSGGEKQRVAIARTLLKNPPLLILDEATSALDTGTERLIQAQLNEVAKGRTTLIIAHRLSTIVEADRILVLEGGRLIESGRHLELLARDGRYAALWHMQAQTLEPATPANT